jgi:hypothetical protein
MKHSAQVRKGDPLKGRHGVVAKKDKFNIRSEYTLWQPPGQSTSHRTTKRRNRSK